MKDHEQEEFDKNLENLRQELRRGTLVLGVLSQLKEPRYGYSLVETLGAKGIQAEAGPCTRCSGVLRHSSCLRACGRHRDRNLASTTC